MFRYRSRVRDRRDLTARCWGADRGLAGRRPTRVVLPPPDRCAEATKLVPVGDFVVLRARLSRKTPDPFPASQAGPGSEAVARAQAERGLTEVTGMWRRSRASRAELGGAASGCPMAESPADMGEVVPSRPNDPEDREDESDEEHDLVAVLPGQHPGGEQTDKPEEAEQSSHKYHWLMAKSTKISFVAVVPEPSHPLRMECRWSRPSGFTDG